MFVFIINTRFTLISLYTLVVTFSLTFQEISILNTERNISVFNMTSCNDTMRDMLGLYNIQYIIISLVMYHNYVLYLLSHTYIESDAIYILLSSSFRYIPVLYNKPAASS